MPKVNYGSGAAGALSGAASGAAIGSVVPGIGTAIGAGVGGLAGGLTGLFGGGKKAKAKQLSTKTKEQEQLLQMINDAVSNNKGPLKDIFGDYDPAAFEEGVSKPALQQFQDEILPELQEKYIAGNQAWGGGRQRAESNAARKLQSDLAQLMYGARNQQKQNKIAGLNTALNTQAFENIYKPASEGVAKPLIGAGLDFAGKYFGNKFASPNQQQQAPGLGTPSLATQGASAGANAVKVG